MTERERLIELMLSKSCRNVECPDVQCSKCENIAIFEGDTEKIADHLLANGVIVPPCKAGDTIWRCGRDKVHEWQIALIEVYADEIGFVDDSDNYFTEDDIGKTVFLTKEEAEQALKGGGKE